MKHVLQLSAQKSNNVDLSFRRFLLEEIDWTWRLNAILGARGTGKTTLLLQRIKEQHLKQENAIYVSLDDYYFTANRIYPFVEELRSKGFTHFFLDEVHKYPGWARELKNIYDSIPDVNVTFTGSSILEILKQEVDLSRRSITYTLPELSFREYLSLSETIDLSPISLEDLRTNSWQIANEINHKIRPLKHFQNYLNHGAYPYFVESKKFYHERLQKTIKLIVESDLQFIEGYNPQNARKINQLLYILTNNVPYKPNVSSLSKKIGITRNTIIQYFHYLEKAAIIHILQFHGISVSALQKPEKVLLKNPNLAFAIAPDSVNSGSLRESFFVSQLSQKHNVSLHKKADFIVDDKYVFEVGGKNKSQKQLPDVSEAYLAIDGVENAVNKSIPLWMFGLLY